MDDLTLLKLLLVGLPNAGLGGLALTISVFLISAGLGVLLGLSYAVAGDVVKHASRPLYWVFAVLRGVPPLLLVFGFAHLPHVSLLTAGILALSLYSACHVGEVFRGYLLAYPQPQRHAAIILSLPSSYDWLGVKLPWVFRHSLNALKTHWISLLKDTGALIVIGIAELTTVTKLIMASNTDTAVWIKVLAFSSGLYLVTTLILIFFIDRFSAASLRQFKASVTTQGILSQPLKNGARNY